ncbi:MULTISPECIES: hypothetical protein [Bacillus cereus group]|uniref:hypothetical protein n=1 Tax=Bacillus cereus group TaxID=86661 RepID=UPI001962AD9D|nr:MULTISPECIES: hypothetical protein [Bacillus cereus group]HDR7875911.1 hypothetical protein [Bacillus mobilis]MBM6771670.1 hypothetical protein [Bacillus cereus]MCC2380799.1 hypothetical protein [Bacillus wiedmannii]MCC2424946.1 hypothetical protein [Bacillus wiedmannii]MCC2494382.1 hypothetical protein [Bacillus cereus]
MQHIEELLNKERNFYDQKVSALINDIELIENASYLSEQEKKDKIRNYCNVLEKDTKCKIEVEFMIQLLKSANINLLYKSYIANGSIS